MCEKNFIFIFVNFMKNFPKNIRAILPQFEQRTAKNKLKRITD